jgi:hypothetical protein
MMFPWSGGVNCARFWSIHVQRPVGAVPMMIREIALKHPV